MAIKEVDINLNRACLRNFNVAVTACGLTDSDIASLTTVLGTNSSTALEAKIRSKTVNEVNVPLREQAASSMRLAKNIGTLPDVGIAAANTLAEVRTLFTDQDSSLESSDQSLFLPTLLQGAS